MKRKAAWALGAAAVLLAACGGSAADGTEPPDGAGVDATSTTIGAGSSSSLVGERLTVGCPGGPFFPIGALEITSPVADVDLPGVEDSMRGFLDGEEGQFWPQEGWRILHATERTVLIVHHDPATGGVAFMDFELRDGRWQWAGASAGGPCPLEAALPAGLGRVGWRLDPEVGDLGPEATVLAVLVTELDCASGQPMGDRLVGPEVVMTETEVLVTFAVRPLPGAQNCQGNPEQLVFVELPAPLGDRVIVDGLATGLDLADFLEEPG